MTWVAWVAIAEGLTLLGIGLARARASTGSEGRRIRLRRMAMRADRAADGLMMKAASAYPWRAAEIAEAAERVRASAVEARALAAAIPEGDDAADGRLSLPEGAS